MKYVIKNLSSFIRKDRLIFMIIILCILCSSVALNFSYGLYYNYNTEKTEYEIDLNSLVPTIAEGKTLTKGDLEKISLSLSEDTLSAMEVIYAEAEIREYPIMDYGTMYMRYTIKNGKFQICETTRKAFEEDGQLKKGRYITNDEEKSGANVAIISVDAQEINENLKTEAGKIKVFDKEYEIIGEYSGAGACPIVPFLTVPDDLKLNGIGFIFYKNITRKQYQEITKASYDIAPDVLIFEELQFPDDDTIMVYNNIIMIAAFISIISAVNVACVYSYIIRKRSRDIAIMRMTGCTRKKLIEIYLGECMTLAVALYAVGFGLYMYLLKNVLAGLFSYISESVNIKVFLLIFITYLLITTIIMVINISSIISKTIKESLSRGGV